jgi:hypothetical protein
MSIDDMIGDQPERAGMQAQHHGWKLRLERLQHAHQHGGRQRHIDRQRDFSLQALLVAVDARADALQYADHASRIFQRRPADIGQLRLARALALEQFQPKLRLEIGDCVADDRLRSVELAAGGGETAGVGDGDKDLKLIESRVWLHRSIHYLDGTYIKYTGFSNESARSYRSGQFSPTLETRHVYPSRHIQSARQCLAFDPHRH